MKFPLLLDTYGVLLTGRKREILEYYYDDDYSLSEISELTGISRQGVRDSIKKSEEDIYEYESKLKIVAKREESAKLCKSAITELTTIIQRASDVSVSQQAETVILLIEKLKSLNNIQSADISDIRE